MKKLTDIDIQNMIGDNVLPDDDKAHDIKNQVRRELKLSKLIPEPEIQTPKKIRIDFHEKTVEQAWELLNRAIHSGARDITVITGASGILKPEFQKWVVASTISDLIIDCKPLNNGSFEIRVKKFYNL